MDIRIKKHINIEVILLLSMLRLLAGNDTILSKSDTLTLKKENQIIDAHYNDHQTHNSFENTQVFNPDSLKKNKINLICFTLILIN